MKITKFVHSCLLVETPDRVALFDPGVMSSAALNVDQISRLDDIFITHIHADHLDTQLVTKLVGKFPDVRITSTPEVVSKLKELNISATDKPSEGVSFFDSPHEDVKPLAEPPQQIGIHFLDVLSHPGDSHSFHETKAIMALPVTAPWGTSIRAINLALELKPQHILPIHDWHWRDEAREQTYDRFERIFGDQDITFHKLQTGIPGDIDVQT
ncbi:MAG TPA: MBL fold metallo-hydrolase [Candidatus Dormibacteraeota bacterium]|nr:MBL fold metallo-hydrolase [Candidatus Dormibacteraeota bacterium]